MALSRIWSSFIIIALMAAIFKLAFSSSDRNLLHSVVIGKEDDTIKIEVTKYDSLKVSETREILSDKKKLNQAKQNGTIQFVDLSDTNTRVSERKMLAYRIQKADGIFETCQTAVTMCLKLIGFLVLFMGILAIAEKAGGIRFLSRIIAPFFGRIFPDVPKGHPAMGHMMMNFSANLMGLDNAATPFGLKAMESLQEINPDKSKASNAQIMFLCLHASGLTLIPVSIIGLRATAHAANPMDIFIPCLIATAVATLASMLIVSFKQRINIFHPVIIMWILGISAVIAGLVWAIHKMNPEAVSVFSGNLSAGLILLIFLLIVLGGLYKKIDVFEAFVSGAKGGFETAIRIIPYLLGMLVAISMLRTTGCFDLLIDGAKQFFSFFGMDTRFVDGLPTAFVKPFSGGAARGMMVDTMNTLGPDSFGGHLACILQGSSDTTFYVIAVYFGAVGIKNTRYTVGAMLLADLVAVVTAIVLTYVFFG